LTKRITTQDVAKLAGVSATTVSRVINQSDHPVNAETAGRVLDAIERLGYTPSALARALVTRRTGIIGALVGDNADPYFALIAHGIHSEARKLGLIAILCNTLRDPQLEIDFVATLDRYRADGIIFAGGSLTDPGHEENLSLAIARYRSNGGNVVTLSEHALGPPCICIDNRQATFDLTKYLITIGHKRIAYVKGPKNLATTYTREKGFIDALQESGLHTNENSIDNSDFTFEGGVRAINRLLNLSEPPTAVIAANDITALGCVVGAQQRGVDVPDKLSVAGMDNIEATLYINPDLTTIEIPMQEMGRLGVQLIQKLIQAKPHPDHITLPHSLKVRGSTAAPPN
jgi:LacI family transcriptional regulator